MKSRPNTDDGEGEGVRSALRERLKKTNSHEIGSGTVWDMTNATNGTKVAVVRCLQHITGYTVRREDGYFWTTSGWSMFSPDNWDGGRWWLRSHPSSCGGKRLSMGGRPQNTLPRAA